MKISHSTQPREDSTEPADFSVSAIPTEKLEQYGAVKLRASTEKPPKPERITYNDASILVDRKWREIHGSKTMPAIFRPYSAYVDNTWIIRRRDNRQNLAYVKSNMVIIGWTTVIDENKQKEKKRTVYSQENHAYLDDSVYPWEVAA